MRKPVPFQLPPKILIFNRYIDPTELTRGIFEIKGAFVVGLNPQGDYLVVKGVGADGTYICDNMDLPAFSFYAQGGDLSKHSAFDLHFNRAMNLYWVRK